MHTTYIKKSLVVALGCACFGSAVTAVRADNARVEEVIVTAQKHEENIQTVPLAITALTANDMQVRGITSFEGVAKSSPSIAMTPYPTSSTLLILYMRGQGVADANQITADGSVGLYEDGFYISRPQAATFDLADVERVEVLRGPQGTLYGRNTTGGAVILIGKQPTGEFGFKQDFTFGTRDQFRSLTTVNLPKWNDLSTKLVMLKSAIDGSVKNTGSSHDYGEEAQLAGRLTLHWTPISDFTVDYFLEKGNLDSTPIWYQNAGLSGKQVDIPSAYPQAGLRNYYADGGKPNYTTYRDFDLNLSKSNFEGHALTLAYDVNDHFTVKSLTGYRQLNWNAYGDFGDVFTATVPALAPLGITDPIPLVSRVFDQVHSHQFSQEVQFVGDAFDSAINYVVGLYYFKEGASHEQDGDNGGAVVLPGSGSVDLFRYQSTRFVKADAKSQALFGQLTWTPPILDEKLSLTAGARYTKDDRDASRDYYNGNTAARIVETNAQNSLSYKRFNPSFTANYTWSDDLSTYLKITSAYKAGGSSESGLPPLGNFAQVVKPEKVLAYEGGLKSYWFEHKVRANIAVFENKFDDMQLNVSVDPNNPAVVSSFNAGKATVKGLELELLVAPVEDVSVGLNYSYLHAQLDSVPNIANTVYDPAQNPASPYTLNSDLKGIFVMPYAPKNSINASFDYKFFKFAAGDLSAHLDYRYQSDIFTSASAGPDVPGRAFYNLPSYGLLNGRLTMNIDLPRGDHAKIGLWGKNLAHKTYEVHTIGSGSNVATMSGSATVAAGYTGSAASWNERPAFGIDLSYEY